MKTPLYTTTTLFTVTLTRVNATTGINSSAASDSSVTVAAVITATTTTPNKNGSKNNKNKNNSTNNNKVDSVQKETSSRQDKPIKQHNTFLNFHHHRLLLFLFRLLLSPVGLGQYSTRGHASWPFKFFPQWSLASLWSPEGEAHKGLR